MEGGGVLGVDPAASGTQGAGTRWEAAAWNGSPGARLPSPAFHGTDWHPRSAGAWKRSPQQTEAAASLTPQNAPRVQAERPRSRK